MKSLDFSKLIAVAMLVCGLSLNAYAVKKVACLGNSITYGATINNDADKYPAQLQTVLGDGYLVRNFGCNSQTVQMDGYDLTEGSRPGDCAYRKKQQYRDALAFKPDIVVIKLGTNDSKNINWTEASPANFRKDLNDMLDEIRDNSNPEILLALPLRVKREDWTINEKNLHEIIPIIKSVASERGLGVINLHTAFEEEKGDDWDTLYNDGVHPNPEGARIIAIRVAAAILQGTYGSEDVTHPLRVNPLISCMGGLRTFGNTLGDENARNTLAYPAVLQALFAANGRTVKVVNAGIGNRTILADGHEDSAGTKPCGYINNDQFRSKVLSLQPDMVTIDLGDKDATAWNWGRLSANFEGDYNDLVAAIRESNPQVKIFICIPPYNKNHTNAANIDGVMLRDEVVPAIKAFASKYELPVIDLNEAVGAAHYQGDNYHLNVSGHEAVASKLYEGLTKDDQSGIGEVIAATDLHTALSTECYDLNGRRIPSSNLLAGIYIIRKTYPDGKTTVEKTVVR
ncbi:MAG: hypothetical protein K2H87_08350 [Duncaniella sp.]|nr:hypothetical protein [Duncaniella sp.]